MTDNTTNQILMKLGDIQSDVSANGATLNEVKSQLDRYGKWAGENDKRIDAVEAFQNEQKGVIKLILSIGAFSGAIAAIFIKVIFK